MSDKNNKNVNDTGAVRPLSGFLRKILLVVLLGAIGWIMYSALNGNGALKTYLRGMSTLYAL